MTEKCQCKSCAGKSAPTKDAITASGFLTSEQLGPKQSFTNEGFLLCEDVPIARTGTQDYAGIELPELEDKDGVIEVERDESVVFSPETIASFLGKPVTIDHPHDGVNPTNWSVLAKGTIHNVRRGEGAQSNLLMADLLITDKGAINDVTSKRLSELSCGYDSDYEQIAPGRARQTSIVGNHVALVSSARCGPVCSVQDSGNLIGGNPMVAKKGATSFADKMRKMFMARDSEGFEKALDEMPGEEGDGKDTHVHIHMPGAEGADQKPAVADADPAADPAADDQMAQVMEAVKAVGAQVAAIGERVTALEGAKTADADPEADPSADPETDPTNDAGPEDKPTKTGDSAAFKNEFQDAKARAEILAPGIKLPTYDAKADSKKTADGLCALRRRALGVALDGANADLVKAVTGDADVSKLTCDSAKAFFNAASELVKRKNASAPAAVQTGDDKSAFANINKTHADFWATRN